MIGTLYLVATPIGNLQDISFRAIEVLKTVDIVACEDTRHTAKLLNHFSIFKKLISYHEHNELKRADELGELLRIGKSIAVLTDAGTPGISDPSFRIVQKAHEIGAKITPLPGAVAFVNALIVSGLPTDSVFFGGFLPSKKGDRKKRLKEVKNIPATLCFYETPRRIGKSLADCSDILGNRKAAVVRELTKIHEEVVAGSLDEISARFSEKSTKGEIVLIIDRHTPESEKSVPEKSIHERVSELESNGLEHKRALKKASKEFGVSKSEAYRMFQSEKDA